MGIRYTREKEIEFATAAAAFRREGMQNAEIAVKLYSMGYTKADGGAVHGSAVSSLIIKHLPSERRKAPYKKLGKQKKAEALLKAEALRTTSMAEEKLSILRQIRASHLPNRDAIMDTILNAE